MPYKYVDLCGKCALKINNIQSPTGYICGRDKLPIREDDFCSSFRNHLNICSICNSPFIDQPQVLKIDDSWIEMCPDCAKNLGHCRTCKNGSLCAFETDPSPEPKIITQQINQNGMQIMTQVQNPERIRITCQNGCPCWSPEYHCSKPTLQSCPQYSLAHQA